ncbi:MAG: ribosome maturation factor RimM [Candidatus Nanopelagicales bacterium]
MQVVVGRIGRAHGIKGDVIVELRTDEPDVRFAPGNVLVTEPTSAGPLAVENARVHSGRFLVHFDSVNDRTSAEQLRGVTLYADVDPSDRPDDPDEFYDHQIVGLQVVDTQRGAIGVVSEISHGPAQDLLTVTTSKGQTVLVPFVSALVTDVDLDNDRLVVALPDGLIELGDG